jgi:tetratricopeptide (TPR) repeat protein
MDNQDLINSFFQGNLSEDEKNQLEELIKSDTEFAKAFKFEKELRDSLIHQERQILKSRLKSLDQQQSKPLILKYWHVAASFLLLIASILFVLNRNDHSTSRLYSEYMEPYPNVLSPVVRSDRENDTVFLEAMKSYDQKNYEEAIHLMLKINEEYSSSELEVYLSISLLMQDRDEEALETLQRINLNSQHIDAVVVDWYLGLAYLKTGDKDKALESIAAVASSGGELSSQASKLLNKLK